MNRGPHRSLLVVLFPLLVLISLSALACGEGDDVADGGGDQEVVEYRLGVDSQVIAGGGSADNVSEIEFAPDGRIFYAEQWKPNTSDGAGQSKAAIRIINQDGSLQTLPFLELPVADWLGLDWGLTGLALDPAFDTNHFIYAFYTAFVRTDSGTSQPVGRPTLIRLTESNGTVSEQVEISADFPETDAGHPGYNANGELHFGPDGMLYASLGDYDLFSTTPDLISGLASPIGKLLRMNPDGTAPADNPFVSVEEADPRVYSYGFREPFPFTWTADGTLYGTDNTTVTCEELNVLTDGTYYGWPEMGEFPFGDCGIAPGEQAIYHFTREGKAATDFLSFVEVHGMAELTGSTYSQITDGLMVCESQRSAVDEKITKGILRRLVLSDPQTVGSSDIVVNDCKGDVAVRDGEVFYTNGSELRKLVEGGAAAPTDEATEASASE